MLKLKHCWNNKVLVIISFIQKCCVGFVVFLTFCSLFSNPFLFKFIIQRRYLCLYNNMDHNLVIYKTSYLALLQGMA